MSEAEFDTEMVDKLAVEEDKQLLDAEYRAERVKRSEAQV